MTRGRKTGGRDFKPGVSGNPKGRPPIRGDLAKVALMTVDDTKRLLQKLMDKTEVELLKLVENPKTPVMELMVIRIIQKAISDGDQARLNFLFDRTIGKVLDKKEIELRPVVYRTAVRADGSLLQEVLEEGEVEGSL